MTNTENAVTELNALIERYNQLEQQIENNNRALDFMYTQRSNLLNEIENGRKEVLDAAGVTPLYDRWANTEPAFGFVPALPRVEVAKVELDGVNLV